MRLKAGQDQLEPFVERLEDGGEAEAQEYLVTEGHKGSFCAAAAAVDELKPSRLLTVAGFDVLNGTELTAGTHVISSAPE